MSDDEQVIFGMLVIRNWTYDERRELAELSELMADHD